MEHFLPILRKTNGHIQIKEDLKSKLDQQSMTKKDWNKIGSDKVLQTTVLENIFQKYLDY